MTERARYLLLALVLTGGLVAYWAVAFVTVVTPSCANDIVAEVPSPSTVRVALVFRRNCGVTTSYGTDVSLLEAGRRPPGSEEAGNIVRVRPPAQDDFPRAQHGGPDVQVAWRSDSVLLVRHHPAAQLPFAVVRYFGVTIEYDSLR